MAGNLGGFGDDPMAPGCYSQLLCGDEIPGLEMDACFGFNSSSFSSDDNNVNAPKMLCFGDYAKQCSVKVAVENGKKTGQRSGSACMDSSSTKITSLPNSSGVSKKRNGSGVQNPGACSGAPTGSQRSGKKAKSENSTVGGHAKVVKKEKLGERITALQQLVSPFGKTDTASVLHEALGYIRFLHEQVQVLCSPYLHRWSPDSSDPPPDLPVPDHGERKKNERRKDNLRSRGLCLVPVDLTLHVANSNGADLWSSTAMVDSISSS